MQRFMYITVAAHSDYQSTLQQHETLNFNSLMQYILKAAQKKKTFPMLLQSPMDGTKCNKSYNIPV